MRRACVRHGHRWIEWLDYFRPPVQTCRRWFCGATRADPTLPSPTRERLDAICRENDA